MNSNMFYLSYDTRQMTQMTLGAYKEIATVERYPNGHNHIEIEKLYWKNIKAISSRRTCDKYIPIYAIDNEQSRFPEDWPWWNLNELTAHESIIQGPTMAGVNRPYLYYAMPFATFGLHHEDSNLGSINIHHGGAARRWYSIPSSNAVLMENLIQTSKSSSITCNLFAKHKSTLIPPETLTLNGIDFGTVRDFGTVMMMRKYRTFDITKFILFL